MSLLKLIGVLLDYPRDELWEHGAELVGAIHDPDLPASLRPDLARFVQGLLEMDPLEAQDRWLSLFDRGRSMSLLLFEHIHGESRDRGQAMVDLVETYRSNGFELAARELPDYLPLLLEYLDQRPVAESRDWLHHVGHIIGLLSARAAERNSPYAVLFTILSELASSDTDIAVMRKRAKDEPRDDTPEAMDRLWEEEAIRFGAPSSEESCPSPGSAPAHPVNRQVLP